MINCPQSNKIHKNERICKMSNPTSSAKLSKMREFVPDVTARGNGQKVQDCYNRLLACENSTDVLNVMADFGGTLGYKCVAYLMEFVRNGETPPVHYFGNASTQPEPTTEEKFPGLDMEFLKSLGYTA